MRIVRLYSILLYTEHMNEWFVFLKMDSIIVLLTTGSQDSGVPFYTDDWIWDTYRATHPLRILLEPEREKYMIQSFIPDGWSDETFLDAYFSGDNR